MTDNKDYERFFRECGYMTMQTLMLETSLSLDDLYQMFKARLQAELGLGERK